MNGYLKERIDSNITIEKSKYLLGLLDVVNFLFVELEGLMKNENRCFGIVKSYINSINDAYYRINSQTPDSNIEDYGRILYLLKPLLKREFKRLIDRKLSPADADITMIRKLVYIVAEDQDLNQYRGEVKTLRKIIDRLWGNIRNRAKNDSMYNLGDNIKTCLAIGAAGKYSVDIFSLVPPEEPKEPVEGGNTRIEEAGEQKKIMEVEL